jgi:dolichyl-phosphate-mannose-protein mannosyltransferase
VAVNPAPHAVGKADGWARRFRAPDLYAIGIVTIVALGVALRAYHLGEQSLWIDEISEGTTAQAPLSQLLANVRSDFGAAPLDYLGVKAFISVFGHGTVATRSWAFVMGCAGVFLVYLLGSRLYRDRIVGLIAAAMLAFSAFDIYYSQEARFYALDVAVGTLNLYVFLRALDSGAVKDWLLYAVATVVALYSHYFLATLLPVEGLYLAGTYFLLSLRNRSEHPIKTSLTQIGMCLAAQLAAVLVFAPWLAFALPSQTIGGYPALPGLGLARIHQIFVVLIALAPLNSLPPAGIGKELRTDLILALALVGLVWALALRQMRVVLLVGIIVLAIPLAWRSDQLGHYFWSERQVIFVLVPLYVLAAIGVRHLLGEVGRVAGLAARRGWFSLSEVGLRQRRAALAAALCVGLAVAWVAVYWSPLQLVYQDRWLSKEDWRGVAAYIDKEGCPDTQYWTHLNARLSYGFGYYDPSLLSRAHLIWRLPDGTVDMSPIEAVQRQNLGLHDWIVFGSGTAASSTTGGTVDSVLRSQGWSPTPFLGVVVYHQQTCGGGTSAGR